MAGNLQLAEERKKTLTADVAHELRTPISVQKAQLEGMLDGVLPVTQENLSIALQQTDFLSRMVDDLRLLAMADAGEVQFEYRETDLKKLILQITTQFQAQMQNEGTRISCTFTPEDANLVINTDPDRLTQILHNLLSNAARYGRKGGNITVSTNVSYEKVLIAVKDDGSGIPDSALPHLFERFYRHEKARSRETGGTGLGLAISKNLALLMGGDLTGVNAPDGGAVFTLSLPMKK
jgi:signal transduction histidine kinase